MSAFIKRFDEIGMQDLAELGGKNASLGGMRRELRVKGVNVPNGFCVTVDGHKHFVDEGEVLGICFLAEHRSELTCKAFFGHRITPH